MAITITDSPEVYTPSDNPVFWKFSSDQTAQPNFSFIVKVFVGGTQVSERQIYPTEGTSAYFDAVNEARNYTSIPQLLNTYAYPADNNTEIYLELYERYGTTPTTQALGATTGTVVVWKAKISSREFAIYDPGDLDDISIGDFINTSNIRLEETKRLLVKNEGNDFDITYSLYDSGAVLVATDTITYGNTDEFSIVNLYYKTIGTSTTLTTANFNDSAYMTVFINGTGISFTYTVNYLDKCVNTYSQEISWVGAWGNIESFTFELYSHKKHSIDSFGYKKANDLSIPSDGFNSPNINTVKRRTGTMIVNSNWLTNDEHEKIINSLYFSPAVYIKEEIENVVYNYRVKIEQTESNQKRTEADMLFKEAIKLGLGTETSLLV